MKTLQLSIEHACKMILPGRPLYVLMADEIPERYRPTGSFGATARGFDLLFRDQIGGRWQGRGPVILLNEVAARRLAELTHDDPGRQETEARHSLWKTAAHELGHIADDQPTETIDVDPEFLAKIDQSMTAFCKTSQAINSVIPFDGHEAPFQRLALHAGYRIRRLAGEWIRQTHWLCPEQYALSAEWKYSVALDGEPIRLADVPLTEISAIAPPAAFVELWRADVRRWWTSLPNSNEVQARVMFSAIKIFDTNK